MHARTRKQVLNILGTMLQMIWQNMQYQFELENV